jgi:hypothetical protein
MEKSPTTDKTIGVAHFYDIDRFSEVRSRAKRDWEERHIRGKRNRHLPVPEYRIDQEIVIAKGIHDNRDYILIKIIDFEEDSKFKYYGIILKVTEKKMLSRVGRLICTGGHWFGCYPANVSPEKIKWVKEENVKSN